MKSTWISPFCYWISGKKVLNNTRRVKYDEAYLNKLIEQFTSKFKGIDADRLLSEMRGDSRSYIDYVEDLKGVCEFCPDVAKATAEMILRTHVSLEKVISAFKLTCEQHVDGTCRTVQGTKCDEICCVKIKSFIDNITND